MSAVMSTDERYEQSMAKAKERAARSQANGSISTSVPSVIERISSPVISPQAYVAPAPVLPVTTEPKPRATKEASYLALGQLGLIGLKTSADDVYLVIAAACKAGDGSTDLTRRELQALFEKRFERRMDASSISARVNELVTAQRVFERKDNRVCSITGNMVGAVYVVMKQTRMVW